MAPDRIWRNRAGKIVILDSSAILMLFEYSINLDSELTRLLGKYHIIIPRQIIEELKILQEKGKGKKKQNAKPALKLIKNYKAVSIEAKNADDAIVNLAQKTNGIVVTNDQELRDRIKKFSLKIIYLRGKNKLEII